MGLAPRPILFCGGRSEISVGGHPATSSRHIEQRECAGCLFHRYWRSLVDKTRMSNLEDVQTVMREILNNQRLSFRRERDSLGIRTDAHSR